MTTALSPRVQVRDHFAVDDARAALRADVLQGLGRRPKELPPRWLYDRRGCELFEEITHLAEYYPTRREREILRTRGAEIAAATRADTLIELGSGTSEKTRVLLDALTAEGTLRRFVAFDVAGPTMQAALTAIAWERPTLEVSGVVGDFEHHLERLPAGGRRLVVFLGGTIGNLAPAGRARLLADLAGRMAPGDALLLGTDLVKDRDRLVAAYDDALGVTAAFNLNVLAMINRELDADFRLSGFRHVARFVENGEYVEMCLRSMHDQVVHVGALGIDVEFDRGEELRTEISTKFRVSGVRSELEAAGLRMTAAWTDARDDYLVSLAVR